MNMIIERETEIHVGILWSEPRKGAGLEHVGFQQIVDRKGYDKHECHRSPETESGFDILDTAR